MVSVLLIGMGKFGRTLGEKLLDMGDEVMIVDKDEDKINALASKYTNALITNCMNEENLAMMDIPSFDACVVAIGDDFQSSLEITSILKDLGAKRVISRATTEIQRKFLMRVGADEVIYPDADIAEKLAIKMNSAHVLNYIELDDVNSIFEIDLPSKWENRTLLDVNPRGRFGMNILTIKRGEQVISQLDGNFVFQAGDQIIVFGNADKIFAFTNKTDKKKK
ncbi:MAG: TrkA family potassium uptake protein [Clostridia bacterium]|nr:TrkA family potassium uptake protein [Clostridia bacterium]MDE6676256.1 TrkA family potassium uptake protein [Clostridia bacterium]